MFKYAKLNNIVYNIILKTEKEEIIYRKILEFVQETNYTLNYNSIKSQVISKLEQMGYSLKHKGTKYITEAIIYIYRM